MKHFQFSSIRSRISSSACRTTCLHCKKTGCNTLLNVARALNYPHTLSLHPQKGYMTLRHRPQTLKKQCSLLCTPCTAALFSHILLDFMTLVKMQPLNIHVWGLSPMKLFPPFCLPFFLSFRECEKLFFSPFTDRSWILKKKKLWQFNQMYPALKLWSSVSKTPKTEGDSYRVN